MNGIKDLKVNLESRILKSKNIVIVPHINIDFDAFASAIGISLIADSLQRPSSIVIDDPTHKMNHSLKEVIEGARKKFNIINREKYISMATPEDLYVLTDVNKSERICLFDHIKEGISLDQIFIIDHHDEGNTTVKSNFKYINTVVSSASEIMVKLLNTFKIKLTPEVANYLLAGIHLDTNRLSKNTLPDTYKIVAKLLECGASNEVVDSWFADDFESDKRVHNLISKANIHKFSFAIVLAEEDCEYTDEELAKVSDYLLKYGIDASFTIGKVDENIISIKARSKTRLNVGEVMKNLDGGGNRYSAATRLTDTTIEEVSKKLIKLIEPPNIIH